MVRRRAGRLIGGAVSTLVAFGVLGGVAQASDLTQAGTIPISNEAQSNYVYTLAPDDTFWAIQDGGAPPVQGIISHYDQDGDEIEADRTTITRRADPFGMTYYDGRVYISSYGGSCCSNSIVSYIAGGDGNDPGLTISAFGMNQRLNNAPYLRQFGSTIVASIYASNKIASFNLDQSGGSSLYYPQVWMGAGVNSSSGGPSGTLPAMQTCNLDGSGVVIGEPDANCGRYGYGDFTNPSIQQIPNPADVALGPDGAVWVAESLANRVGIFSLQSGLVLGAVTQGSLNDPISIVRDPATNHMFVSEGGDYQLSEFDQQGNFVASHGWGVRTGASQFEKCGPEAGAACLDGIPGFGVWRRLDINSQGQLYANVGGTIKVFDIDGSTEPPQDEITMKAKPGKVKKGEKTNLSATVGPESACDERKVLFQVSDGPGNWNNVGRAIGAGGDCKAARKSGKITRKSKFRAVSINTTNESTMATSTVVNVKIK